MLELHRKQHIDYLHNLLYIDLSVHQLQHQMREVDGEFVLIKIQLRVNNA